MEGNTLDVRAQYLRFTPVLFKTDRICLRLEIYGCSSSKRFFLLAVLNSIESLCCCNCSHLIIGCIFYGYILQPYTYLSESYYMLFVYPVLNFVSRGLQFVLGLSRA